MLTINRVCLNISRTSRGYINLNIIHCRIGSLELDVSSASTTTTTTTTTETIMKSITLSNDGAADVKFIGELLAGASSRDNNSSRWTELSLYRTQKGRFVCHSVGVTLWDDETNRSDVQVCKTEAEVKNYFGQGRLAKELYKEANIENIQIIE